jgi:hypothetical protein
MRIPRVRAALLRSGIVAASGERRGFGAVRLAGIRARAGLGGIAPSRIEPPRTASFPSAQRLRELETPRTTSRVQGLSHGFGFRRPARRGAVGAWPLKARLVVSSLGSPAPQFLHLLKILNGAAASRTMSRRVSTQELVSPSVLARLSVTGIQWPGTAQIGRRGPCQGPAPAVREWAPFWNVSELAGFPNPRRSLAAFGRCLPKSCMVALPLAPVRANGAAHHVARAPFAPQNSPFGYKEYQ